MDWLWLPAAAALALVAGAAVARLADSGQLTKLIVVMAASVIALAMVLQPRVGLAGLLFILPFETQVGVGDSVIGTTEALAVAVTAAAAWRIRWSLVPRSVKLGGGLLVLGSALSCLTAVDVGSALWGTARWAMMVVLLAAALTLCREPGDLRKATGVLCLAGTICAVAGWMQSRGDYSIAGAPYLADRIDSTFGYYTQFAGFMAVVTLLALGQALSADTATRIRVLYAGVAAIASSALVVSLSRGGLLSLIVGALVMLLALRAGARTLQLVALIGFSVAILWVAVPRPVMASFADRLSVLENAGDRVRYDVQRTGRAVIVRTPLGLGYGNFPDYQAAHPGAMATNVRLFHVHQTPTQIGLDAGWIGLAGFLVLILTPLVGRLRDAVRGGISFRTAAVCGALAGFLAQGIIDYLYAEYAILILTGFFVWALARDVANPEQAPGAAKLNPSPRAARLQAEPRARGAWRR